MTPLFSVVTVVYNGADKIRKTVESVLNQEFLPYEYIIIDGLSKDNTVEIVKSYDEQFKEKNIILKIISEKDSGIYNAMNKAINIVTGEFISFLNSGDWYETDALKNMAQAYSEKEFDMAYGGLHYINPNGSIINKMSKLDRFWITSRHWNHPSMFLRKEIYQKYMFDESYKIYSDFALYLKLRKCYFLSHNFWALRVENLLKSPTDGQQPWAFMGNNIGYYEIDESIDIHKEVDLLLAKEWIKENIPQIPAGGGTAIV